MSIGKKSFFEENPEVIPAPKIITGTPLNRLQKFEKLAERKGFNMTNVPSDGNCLVSAVGSYFDMTARDLRDYLSMYVKNCSYKNDFFEYDENFIKDLEKEGAWCGEETIKLVSDALDARLVILNERTESIVEIGTGPNIIFLGYLFNYHYVILTPIGETQKIYKVPARTCARPYSPRSSRRSGSETGVSEKAQISESEIANLVAMITDVRSKARISTFMESERALLKTVGLI